MNLFRSRAAAGALSLLTGAAALMASPLDARAAPSLVVDAATGAVLHAEEATRPWYPASLTKLMTVYVALRAVHERRFESRRRRWWSPIARRAWRLRRWASSPAPR